MEASDPQQPSSTSSQKPDEAPESKIDAPEEQNAFGAYKRIFQYAGRTEAAMQIVALCAALASGTGVALQNLIFGEFITVINNFASGSTPPAAFRDEISSLALYFVYLGIGRFVLAYVYNLFFTYAAHRIIRNIRREYMKSALRQEIAFYDAGSSGSIAIQATANGRLIQNGITEKLGLFIQGMATFIAAFAIAFAAQWKLTLICLCIAPVTMVIMGVVAGFQTKYQTQMIGVYMLAGAFAEGILGSARAIHAFSMRERLVDKYDGYLEKAYQLGLKQSSLLGLLFSSQYTIIQLGMGLAFWQGIRMLASGEISSSGDVFVVLLSIVMASINLTSMAPHALDFTQAAAAAAKLFTLIDRPSNIDPFDDGGEKPEELVSSIKFEDVSFAYPTRPDAQVLSNFSLEFPAGKVTALVGPSGSGKSTIIGLIERWNDPNSGTITLGGHPLGQLNLNWLRKHVRLVQQEPVLFQGTIADNISHGLVGTPWESVSAEEQRKKVEEAAKLAFAHDFITELPEGYNTMVGQRGSLLSGGQKQRIAIARSIISEPKVLLLDEATSALDPHSEKVVQQALDSVSQGRTTITIAHKLATIRKADNIVVMRHGKIVEQGTHEALIEQGGTYRRLVEIQSLAASAKRSGEEMTDNDVDSSGEDVPVTVEKTLTRHASSVAERTTRADSGLYDYSNHKHSGILSAVYRLLRETPGLVYPFAFVMVACLGAAAAYPGQAMLMASTVDVFTIMDQSRITERGDFFASMFIVLAAGCLISYFTVGYATNIVAQKISRMYRRQMVNDVLRLDLAFFDRSENSPGAVATRANTHPNSILELMGFNLGLILISVLNLLSCSILSIAYSWKLGLVVVCAGLPAMVGAGYLKVRADGVQERATAERYLISTSIASESILALRTVSSLAIESSVLQRYTQALDDAISSSMGPLCVSMLFFGFVQAVEYWFMALGFWYGSRLLSFNEIAVYNFMVSFLAVFLSGQAASIFFQFSTSITNGINAANYMFWLNGLEPAINETPDNHDKHPSEDHSIAFRDTRFAYPLRPDVPVLRGLNMTVKKGQFVGLVGASGCGKSTIIAMLERFYDPIKGSITIGPSHLADLNPRLYRGIVALVQQEPTLFEGTIRENVALGLDPSAVGNSNDEKPVTSQDAAIEDALRAANAWDFASSLPAGLDTSIGTNGTQLSGGQRQRIAIARALIRNPRILLLDEATSALDTESERIIQEALEEAAKGGQDRITVAVAHRLSTVKHADVICVLYEGKVAEMGKHEELIARDGMYRKMCEAQALD